MSSNIDMISSYGSPSYKYTYQHTGQMRPGIEITISIEDNFQSQDKVGCIFPLDIWPELSTREYRDAIGKAHLTLLFSRFSAYT